MAIITPRGVQVHPPSSRIDYKRRPAPLILTQHSQAIRYSLLRRPLSSPSVVFCIPIASTACTVLARAGLRNLCNAEIMLGIAEQSGFWGVSLGDCSLAPQTTTSSTSWWSWPNNNVLYIPVVGPVFPKWTPRSSRLLSDGHLHCNDWVRLHQTALTDTMSSHGNGASGDTGNGPALGYFLNLF